MEKFYSENIVEIVRDFIVKGGWKYKCDEYKGIVTFVMEVKGTAGRIDYLDYRIKAGNGGYTIYVILPMWVDVRNEKMMSVLAEFICRINYGIKTGSFEMNMVNGIIQFKYCINCMNITPPKEFVENSILWPKDMFERYLDGFADIIAGDDNARDAMDRCEKAFLEKRLSGCQARIYGGADGKEEDAYRDDDYFYDEDDDIDLDFDNDNVYYVGENIDRYLDWCLSWDGNENKKTEFEVNMDLFGVEGDEEE